MIKTYEYWTEIRKVPEKDGVCVEFLYDIIGIRKDVCAKIGKQPGEKVLV